MLLESQMHLPLPDLFFNIFNPWTYKIRCSFCAFVFGVATYFEKTIFSFTKTHINVITPAFHIIIART